MGLATALEPDTWSKLILYSQYLQLERAMDELSLDALHDLCSEIFYEMSLLEKALSLEEITQLFEDVSALRAGE